ncbi:MAG: hypothetical protein U9P42_09095 [Candidatus Fermentibacteria bacterium]|nr:hypothetical protein [Candidatus Fermentibacteria bacterium]
MGDIKQLDDLIQYLDKKIPRYETQLVTESSVEKTYMRWSLR